MDKYSELKQKLQDGKNIDIHLAVKTEIDQIENININTKIPKEDRILKFLDKVKNPYIFIINDMTVKFEYSNNNIGIADCIERLIINKGNF